MDNNTLSHHGIKGMKWGIRRTPAQLGHKPSGKRKKLKSSPGAVERVKKALARHKQAAEAKKAKKQAEEEVKEQKSREEILKRGSASEVMSLKGKISNSELQSAVNRLNLERQLSDLSSKDNPKKDKLSETMDKVDKLNQNTKKGIDAYNTVAKILNSLTDTDLPTIDGSSRKEQKEKKAEAEQKKREEKERKAVEDIIKRGDTDEIKKNIHRFTASDCEFLKKRKGAEKDIDDWIKSRSEKAEAESSKSDSTDSGTSTRKASKPTESWWKSGSSDETVSKGETYVSDLLGLPAPKDDD